MWWIIILPTLIMVLYVCIVMVRPPFFPLSSLSPFVCAPPHLCHLPTPSDLVHLPSTHICLPSATVGRIIIHIWNPPTQPSSEGWRVPSRFPQIQHSFTL